MLERIALQIGDEDIVFLIWRCSYVRTNAKIQTHGIRYNSTTTG